MDHSRDGSLDDGSPTWTVRDGNLGRWDGVGLDGSAGSVHYAVARRPAPKVLSYTDLGRRLGRAYACRRPAAAADIRLTGNMDKFIWSFPTTQSTPEKAW